MTTQDMIDWAFAQEIPAEQKLALVAIAWAATPVGGGSIKLGILAERMCVSTLTALGCAFWLQAEGLIILHYAPALDSELADADEIRFGLCIAGGGSS